MNNGGVTRCWDVITLGHLFRWVVRVGCSEEVIFKLRCEGGKVAVGRKFIPSRGD